MEFNTLSLYHQQLRQITMQTALQKLAFIINPGAGNSKTNWKEEIEKYFANSSYELFFYQMKDGYSKKEIKEFITKANPSKVIAAGGDGTVKLVAECLVGNSTPLGILPAGSANGMAREFSIPTDPGEAMKVIEEGNFQSIHLLKVNDEICIHLSDAGFNAYVVKKFEEGNVRGQWGYIKAAWKALWNEHRMQVTIRSGDEFITYDAAMVVLANATMYGNGVVINPEGSITDDLFEIVIIKKISVAEIVKMKFTQQEFNKKKTELFQTDSVEIKASRPMHFQVDGEYRGKLNSIHAEIMPGSLQVIVPAQTKKL